MQTAKKTKLQVSLDQGTLDWLDYIVRCVPDVESRSAAIRWAARIGVEKLSLRPETKKEKRR